VVEIILSTLSCVSLTVCLVFVARFWFRSMKAYSKLVEYEYENLPKQWVKDGEPDGMVYWQAPKRSKNLLNRFVRSNPAMTLLPLMFNTPKWIEDHPEAQEHIKDMRKNALWWNIGVIGFAILLVLILFVSTLWIR
jgi:hypothetical protein